MPTVRLAGFPWVFPLVAGWCGPRLAPSQVSLSKSLMSKLAGERNGIALQGFTAKEAARLVVLVKKSPSLLSLF